MSLPLDSHPAAPKGYCGTPLESPESVSEQVHFICADSRVYLVFLFPPPEERGKRCFC